MAYPTSVSVYIDFVTNAFTDAATWTNVTQWVCGPIEVRYGRDSQVGEFQPGTGRTTLLNNDARFDPSNTSSPYYPNLTPRRRIKVESVVSGITYPLSYGWLTGWPQSFQGRKHATVDIEWVDGLAMLARVPLPDSVWDYRIRSLSPGPYAWYKLGDTTSLAVDSSGNARHGRYFVYEGYQASFSGSFAPDPVVQAGAADTVIPASGRPGVNWAQMQASVGQPLSGIVGTARTPCLVTGGDTLSLPSVSSWSVETWVLFRQAFPLQIDGSTNPTTPMDQPVVTWGHPAIEPWWELGVLGSSAKPYMVVYDASGASLAHAWNKALDDRVVHHVVWVNNAGTVSVYVDGVNISTTMSVAGYTPPKVQATVNYASWSPDGLQSTLGDIIFWNRALSGTEIAANFYAGMYGNLFGSATTTSGIGISQALQMAGWNLATTIGATTTGLQVDPGVPAGRRVNDYIRDIVTSEQGMFYQQPDGKLVFYGRDWPIALTRAVGIQYTVSDGAVATLGYENTSYRMDDGLMGNDVTVTFKGGVQRSQSASSVAAYGVIDSSVSTVLSSAADAKEVANLLVAQSGTPPTIQPTVTLRPNTLAEFAMCLVAEPGTRVSLRHHRADGTAWTDEVLVGSVEHRIEPMSGGEWVTTWGMIVADDPARPFTFDTSGFDSTHIFWI